MTVQWFPGHMAKTRRLMKESLHLVDAVCEIVDARIPESSRNPEIDEIVGSKPRIVLLNKCDLADDNATARKIKELAAKGITALPVDCRRTRNIGRGDIGRQIALPFFGNGGTKGASVNTRIGAATAHNVAIIAKQSTSCFVQGTLNRRDAPRLYLIAIISRSDKAELDHCLHCPFPFVEIYMV